MAGSHAERIMALLAKRPGLDDDEIAKALSIEPRQTVNQVCRRLEKRGVIERRYGASGKIVNVLTGADPLPAVRRSAPTPRPARKPVSGTGRVLVPERFDRCLLIIPCAKGKFDGGEAGASGPQLTDQISPALAVELGQARQGAASRTPFDERALMPAWQRYDGSLYRSGGNALGELLEQGMHIIILSGGYGAVLADEPIGNYNQALKTSWWPNRLLQRVLLSYAQRQGIECVRAFASATSAYFRVLSGMNWDAAGVEDALLIAPETQPGGTLKSPASIGEAITSFAARELRADWQSSYGLGLEVYSS